MNRPAATMVAAVLLAGFLPAPCAGGSLTPGAVGEQEVLYRGEPLSHWRALLESRDAAVCRETLASMKEMAPGIDALLPLLGDAVEDGNREVRLTAVEVQGALGRQRVGALTQLIRSVRSADPEVRLAGLILALKDPDAQVVGSAVEMAGDLGSMGPRFVPSLIKILRSRGESRHSFRAAVALQKIGPEA